MQCQQQQKKVLLHIKEQLIKLLQKLYKSNFQLSKDLLIRKPSQQHIFLQLSQINTYDSNGQSFFHKSNTNYIDIKDNSYESNQHFFQWAHYILGICEHPYLPWNLAVIAEFFQAFRTF
ncbi:UNKNOWN [Stylonychia lemnae]|uniref:Uncharacterized protein n=1 Tax=Stylonychia lemnae TaxID=5949 RepID=A0A078AFU0_STYLE|nr:UNKNOWN [Stylonychia lemnae]|eukprot:CDW81135.1 UNKNOWN [Stylonychia lemnae]